MTLKLGKIGEVAHTPKYNVLRNLKNECTASLPASNDWLPIPDLSQYKETIETWPGIEDYADFTLEQIDGSILALQGEPHTPTAGKS
ncbi:hypothetical protein BM221_004345 [Beauveria bassiana]|uniref:Uncharacterized protein n=1 Tax=Beauveria bassiana TaxID=176275 RepID=A0A2N6NR16_BEABA|nr:hypothetical protein BM221_004345 [Beauveria bassiana]